MLFLPNMHWPEASQTLLLSSGTGSMYRVYKGSLCFWIAADYHVACFCWLAMHLGNASPAKQTCSLSATCQYMIVLFLMAED